jgi:hypothetical protein
MKNLFAIVGVIVVAKKGYERMRPAKSSSPLCKAKKWCVHNF